MQTNQMGTNIKALKHKNEIMTNIQDGPNVTDMFIKHMLLISVHLP